MSHTSVTGDEESEGLEFIDPEAEKRARLAEAAKEKDENEQMILINGQLVPASSLKGQNNTAKSGPKTGRNRYSLINELKNKTLAKRSANFDISKLKGTFQTTDLNSKKRDFKKSEDPLAEDIAEEEDMFDDEEDKDFKPDSDGEDGEETDKELAAVCEAVWDEDENIKS